MNVTPEIIVACTIGWWCLSVATAYFWGKMKAEEPMILYGVHRFRLDEHSGEQVGQEPDSTSGHSTKAGQE